MPTLVTVITAGLLGVVLAILGLAMSVAIGRRRPAEESWAASRTDVGFILLTLGLVVVIGCSGGAAYLALSGS